MKEALYNRKLVALSACLCCAFFGITMYFWGAMLPILQADIENISSLPWILTIGIILGTAICGFVMDRYGYKWLLILSSLSLAVGLLIFSYLHSYPFLVLSAILIGAGGGVLNSETIAIISDIYEDSKRGVMLSILGGSYCLGSLLWTIMCRVLISNQTTLVLYSSLIIIVLSILFTFIKFPPAKIKQSNSLGIAKIFSLLKNELLVVVAFVLFFQGMVEAISANFCTSYFTNIDGGISKEAALTSLILMTVGMTIGRFSLPVSIKYLRSDKTLYLFLAIALIGAILQKLFATSLLSAYISMALIGFGVGATSPIVFDYLGQVFKKYSGVAVSIVVIVAQVGMMLGNLGIGYMFSGKLLEGGYFRSFPIVMAFLIVVVMLSFPQIIRSVSKQKKIEGLDL